MCVTFVVTPQVPSPDLPPLGKLSCHATPWTVSLAADMVDNIEGPASVAYKSRIYRLELNRCSKSI